MESKPEDSGQCQTPQRSVGKVSVSTTCKACNKDFTASTIFKHVTLSVPCKTAYSKEEFQAFRNWRIERKKEKRRKSYDPIKRKRKYQQQKKIR